MKASRILLVGDHSDTACVMRKLLSLAGHSVEWAASVAEGVKLASGPELDLLLCDVRLPDGTGLDVMRTVCERGSTLPGIVISGHDQEQDVARALEAGFGAHLIKPLNPPDRRGAII